MYSGRLGARSVQPAGLRASMATIGDIVASGVGDFLEDLAEHIPQLGLNLLEDLLVDVAGRQDELPLHVEDPEALLGRLGVGSSAGEAASCVTWIP